MEAGPPFVLVYGSVLWTLSCVVVFGLAFWSSFKRWSPRSLRRTAKKAIKAVGESVSDFDAATDGTEIVLRGRLKSEGSSGQPILRLEDGTTACAATAIPLPRPTRVVPPPVAISGALTPRAVLDVGGAEVLLGDPLEVVVGSREHYAGKTRRFDRGQRERLLAVDGDAFEHLDGNSVAFLSLESGDQVRARGIIRRVAGLDEPCGYRNATAQWVLFGEPKPMLSGSLGEPKVLVAFDGNPSFTLSRGLRALRASLVSVIVAGLFLALSWAVGAASVELGESGEVDLWTTIASVTPFHRHVALGRIADEMRRHRPRSADDLSRLAAMRSLSGGCESGVWTLACYGDFERAIEEGRSCSAEGSRRITAGALYALGRFDEASQELDSFEPHPEDEDWMASPFATRVHLLADRSDRAIESARLRSSRLREARGAYQTADLSHIDRAEERSAARDITMDGLLRRAEAFDCIADALEARGGDVSAKRLLHGRAAVTKVCALLAADLVPDGENALSQRERWQQNHTGANRISELLLLEVQPYHSRFSRTLLNTTDGRKLRGLHRFLQQTSPGVERAALAAMDNINLPTSADELNQAELRMRAAVLEYLSGDHEAARLEVQRAVNLIKAAQGGHGQLVAYMRRPRWMDSAKALSALIEIDAGQIGRAREIFATVPSVVGSRFERLGFLLLFAEQGLQAGVILPGDVMAQRAVASGDGEEIAALLGQHDALRQTARLWTPRVRSNRSTLVSQLRWSDENRCRECTLAQIFVDASNRRSAALSLGDEDWAESFDLPIERIREAMLRRDIAVPLWVLDHIDD